MWFLFLFICALLSRNLEATIEFTKCTAEATYCNNLATLSILPQCERHSENNSMGTLVSKIVTSGATTKMARSPEIQQFIKEAIVQDKVVVFSKSYCPYCKLAKDVFKKVKQPIRVYELDERDDGAVIQDTLAEITGFKTVPQVFINGNCVGGGSDVKALHESGELEPMLIG